MNTVFGLFLIFFFLVIALSLWSLYDQHRFTRFEGSLKRGLRVWAEPLSWEMRQFLESLPSSVQIEQSFIRKEINEVLIAEKRSFWGSFLQRRRNGLYVAYVNLSAPENQIEFRAPFFSLASAALGLMIVLLLFAGFFWQFVEAGDGPIFICFFPFVFLLIFIGSHIFSYYQARRRLLDFLNRAMRQQT